MSGNYFQRFFIGNIGFQIRSNVIFTPLRNRAYALFERAGDGLVYDFHFEQVKEKGLPPEDILRNMRINKKECILSPRWDKNRCLSRKDIVQRVKKVLSHRNSDALVVITDEVVEILNFGERKSRIYFTPQASPHIQNLLCPIFSSFFVLEQATILHSSGLIKKGRAALFLAPSGGGKSTVVDLAPEDTILLSEDMVMTRYVEGCFLAFGTPLGGRTDGPNKAEIKGFFRLRKGKQFKLTRLNPKEVLGEVWDDNYLLWSFLPVKYRLTLFSLYYDMFSNVPAFRMEFPRDFVDWDQIDKILTNQSLR